jgi:hypothetical protein
VRGCLTRLLGLALLLALAAGAWLYRAPLQAAWRRFRHHDVALQAAPSRDLAVRTERRIATLERADRPARLSLHQSEIQSLVHYELAPQLPGYLRDPRIQLQDGRVKVTARVPTAALPEFPGSSEIMGLLPDTADISTTGRLLPLDSGRVALTLDDLSAASIPLPSRLIPALLTRAGRRDEPGLPQNALAVTLPAGACTAFVSGDSLVLVTPAARTGCR